MVDKCMCVVARYVSGALLMSPVMHRKLHGVRKLVFFLQRYCTASRSLLRLHTHEVEIQCDAVAQTRWVLRVDEHLTLLL